MSGGVDSAVVASLLKSRGFNVIGVYLDCWDNSEYECQSEADRVDALKVATYLGIKFLTWDFKKEYKLNVLSYFLESYRSGETPNPDVLCNTFIKFGVFASKVLEEDPNAYIATGHYAKIFEIEGINERLLLGKGTDTKKDQSYFLYNINPEVLKNVIFPIGDWQKSDVRDYALKNGLIVSKKPDSQGVCFTGGINVKEYLLKELGEKMGDVVNLDGELIGTHKGEHLYTVGERYVGFQNLKSDNSKKLYIVEKDVERNILIVSDSPFVNKKSFFVKVSNYYKNLIDYAIEYSNCGELFVQIRNTGLLYKCNLTAGKEENLLAADLNVSVSGVATGQSAVFYIKVGVEHLIVLGGIIRST